MLSSCSSNPASQSIKFNRETWLATDSVSRNQRFQMVDELEAHILHTGSTDKETVLKLLGNPDNCDLEYTKDLKNFMIYKIGKKNEIPGYFILLFDKDKYKKSREYWSAEEIGSY